MYEAIKNTHLNNTGLPLNFPWQSWNCHQWVGDALENLRVELCLPAEVIRAALDAMVNAIVEAKD